MRVCLLLGKGSDTGRDWCELCEQETHANTVQQLRLDTLQSKSRSALLFLFLSTATILSEPSSGLKTIAVLFHGTKHPQNEKAKRDDLREVKCKFESTCRNSLAGCRRYQILTNQNQCSPATIFSHHGKDRHKKLGLRFAVATSSVRN